MMVGFLVWIFFDPPGHNGYFVIMTVFAMAVAGKPQVNLIILIKAIAVAFMFGLVIYVFTMPRLSTFIELGAVLFIALFIIRWSFSGLAQLVGSYGIIKMISLQNHQIYDFAAIFGTWSEHPDLESAAVLRERLKALLARLDQRIGEALEQTNTVVADDRRQQNVYRLLARARGVSEATIAYAGVANTIDWAQWREEVFS